MRDEIGRRIDRTATRLFIMGTTIMAALPASEIAEEKNHWEDCIQHVSRILLIQETIPIYSDLFDIIIW